MADMYPKPLSKLIAAFEMFPGIGRKMASRLAFYLLTMDDDRIKFISDAIKDAKAGLSYCSICCNITQNDPCEICKSDRDHSVICVVSSVKDLMAMERTCEFDGVYHVLHGVISPMEGVNPEDLKIKELLKRLDKGVTEVIIATNSSVEGEATAMYLSRLIKPFDIKVTRIAHGISVGTEIEYADEATLIRALKGRIAI
ncbi:MAG TPA: recombination mediator RecR [Clostridia bacterium]|jgi:recombination protein RecR|nr:recombination mediator RecR [Clostridia bacterium]MDD3094509.1 recombination mediator RecR [Clostridia bacterium]MDD3970368.1 recombination mediator RecR [Clostridia bacterium]HPJ75514.1 recombination mediator RecR [Clostridia bacterium]HXK71381.1 recombination mediator RecR [Clostridia bacterium]